jgi:hypothetical protein
MACYWDGGQSKCRRGGPIEAFVTQMFPGISILQSDGLGALGSANTPVDQYPDAPYVGALCSRVKKPNLVLLPLDDNAFETGVLTNATLPAWETRHSTLFWRGGASGYDTPSLRARVVRHLYGHPHADVKLTHWGGWENGKGIPEEHFSYRCSLEHHFQYKYIPIIDGNCIASNHQWVFGSGAVPLMITHPDNDFWFKEYLEPMVHYVPIQYDLSDLTERLDWLVANDDQARQIAENAKRFANSIFSPEFQRVHLMKRFHPVEGGGANLRVHSSMV